MQSSSPYERPRMASPQMNVPRLCSSAEGLLPSRPWSDLVRILRLFAGLTCLRAFHFGLVHLASLDSHQHHLMPRPRGRPRRGSPWKPRRPSLSPPDSPSICSSPPLQPEPITPPSPAPLVSQLNSLAIIPRMSGSPSRLCIASTLTEPDPTPVFDFPRSSGGAPPPPRRPGNSEHQPSDSYNGVQLRESLDIIYGLVFELRQGVEDLHFRLQTTDDKMTTLLQLLSSMREAFPSDPVGATSEEVPRATTDGGTPRNNAQ
jgi:hypothetical protein